jgi:hypothetical protein
VVEIAQQPHAFTMPKYSVEEVIDIIRSLTAEEQATLAGELPTVLDLAIAPFSNATPVQTQSQTRSMSVGGDFKVGGTGATVDFSQVQTGGNQAIATPGSAASTQVIELQAILDEFAGLKQAILEGGSLNPVQKATAEVPLQIVQAELQKPKPDRSLVGQAIATLKQGLEGIQNLAEPTLKVAELVAKAWLVL